MNCNLSIKSALALILAISLVAAPAAAARFDFEPTPPALAQVSNPSTEVHSNTGLGNHQTGDRGMPPILRHASPSDLAAIRQTEQQKSDARREALKARGYASFSSTEMNAYAALGHAKLPPAAPTVSTPGNGFDWGDAAIGAAAGIALSLLALGGVLIASRRRSYPSSDSTAITS
jgi:hypothetical protein